MAKHNQRNTLGTLVDFQSAPQPLPETTDERIDRLERRLLQVETLLNDVMQVLDKPFQNKPASNGKPQATQKKKWEAASAIKTQSEKYTESTKPHLHRLQPKNKSERTSKPL